VVLFITILLVIYGVFSALTGTSVNINVGPTHTPSGPATATAFQQNPSPGTPSTAWWQVYFTDRLTINDPNNYAASIEGKLIDHINAARTSIHIASFEFDLKPVAEALIAAHQRGVDVRWVTDDENGLAADTEPGHGQFAMLRNAGIEVRSDNRTALMHNKFWIFDDQILWTGSTNITKNGIFVQDNNTIVFSSPELAAIYEREFEEMWDGQFGPKSPSQLDQQSLVLNGTPIEVIFTSEDPALETKIIPLVRSARSSIRFLAFSFTDYPLAQAMIERAQQGVNVSGVMDKTQSGGEGSELATLFCGNIPVRQDGNPQFMHSKVIIVDDRYVITGSLNFSTSAEESNDENVIILDNPDIARLYVQNFDRVYSQGAAPDPSKVTCP
jgi:phosphatidylserine/phosphatidylglycerophosphate/cardiolipin synthase-like enzyme